MNCKEVQNDIIPFIENRLSVKEMEAFLRHMDDCKECRKEYDVYYTLIMGMHYLEEEDEKKEFRINPEDQLRAVSEYVIKYRIFYVEKIILLVALCLLFIVLML